MDNLDLPSAGAKRFWNITHQPNKKLTPLRIELRQKEISSGEALLSLSKLIGFADTVADPDKIKVAAQEILARAGRVDEFVGIHA